MKKVILGFILLISMLNAEFLRDESKEVVLDTRTNLIWQDNNDVSDLRKRKTWSDAIEHCKNSTLGGFTNWRLPNFNELYYIADRSTFNPAISPVFKNVANSFYWSSSTLTGRTSYASGVYFHNGVDSSYSKPSGGHVRCVRASDN